MDFRIATLKELLGRGHLCSGRIHDPRLAVQLLQYFNKAKSQPVSALQQLISELEKQYETLKFILCDVWGHILIIQPIGSENAIACSYKIEDLDLSLVSEIITERSFSYRLRPVLKSLSGVTSLQISCPDEELPEQWDSDFLSRLVNLRFADDLSYFDFTTFDFAWVPNLETLSIGGLLEYPRLCQSLLPNSFLPHLPSLPPKLTSLEISWSCDPNFSESLFKACLNLRHLRELLVLVPCSGLLKDEETYFTQPVKSFARKVQFSCGIKVSPYGDYMDKLFSESRALKAILSLLRTIGNSVFHSISLDLRRLLVHLLFGQKPLEEFYENGNPIPDL